MASVASLRDVTLQHKKRALEIYKTNNVEGYLPEDYESQKIKILCKISDEYAAVKDLPPPAPAAKPAAKGAAAHPKPAAVAASAPAPPAPVEVRGGHAFPATPGVVLTSENAVMADAPSSDTVSKVLKELPKEKPAAATSSGQLVVYAPGVADIVKQAGGADRVGSRALIPLMAGHQGPPKPEWHAPWKLMRVISGHTGWVRSVAVDPSNEWFATGSADRTIKVWELATGQLKLTLTGHINAVRGLAVSDRHPYLFSVAEDKQVKCWDLEYNKVVRQYHGHLSGVYCCTMHPTIDLLITGGRDSSARVWDIRSKAQIHVLSGHTNTVASVLAQATDPQIITGSNDTTIRCWDLVAGKTSLTLTNHKKSIRAMCSHPNEFTFVSGAPDNLKHWKLPECNFIKNFTGHKGIVNSLALNRDNVLFSGGDNGSMHFWDWRSGYNFQELTTTPQPGSLESEAGVFCSTFDMTGGRLITGEADKSIKIWREDETATPETHPIQWTASKNVKRF